ncbi:hypothetical protein C8039_07475 [Halogeometricum sp. wsp3]|nr:hypothetical protein C8039_07475 [Halogeometricum sp. wsp3]
MLSDGDSSAETFRRQPCLVTGVSTKQDSRLDAIRRQTPEWTRIIEFETTPYRTEHRLVVKLMLVVLVQKVFM